MGGEGKVCVAGCTSKQTVFDRLDWQTERALLREVPHEFSCRELAQGTTLQKKWWAIRPDKIVRTDNISH